MTDPHLWPRLSVSDALAPGVHVVLTPEADHYLRRVLRRGPGDDVRLFNERDGEVHARLALVPSGSARGKRAATAALEVVAVLRPPEKPPCPEIWLYAAPLKKAHVDFLVMKATELGIAHLQLILTDRTQVQGLGLAHLQAVALEAAEQSERLSIPTIHASLPLRQVVETWPADRLPLVCAEIGPARPVAEALQPWATLGDRAPLPPSLALFTGPEGGFTLGELQRLAALPNVLVLRLGARILRAETAALTALACWQMFCGEGRAPVA